MKSSTVPLLDMNPLIPHILSGISITRWNTFPRLQTYTTLDHLAFVIHICLTLSSLLEEKEDIKPHKGILIRQVLFGGFYTFLYSDISSEVKHRLKNNSPEIYHALDRKIIDTLEAYNLHSRILTDIHSTYEDREPTMEDHLINFAKAWASYYETYHNSLVYADAYSPLLQTMHARIDTDEHAIFLKYLDLNPLNQTGPEKYLLTIHRLASSYRWNRMTRKYPVSVLGHLVLVAFMTYFIGIYENIDDSTLDDMLETALFHDIPEAITGDIITPTKKAVPGLEASIEMIEASMVQEYLIAPISTFQFASQVENKMLHPWQESNGSLVKLADIFSALFEADLERDSSGEFSEIYYKLLRKVSANPSPAIEGILGKV